MGKFQEILKSEKALLVDFHATWCGPCQQLHPILESLKEKKKDGLRILKIDVDKNQAIAEQFKVRSVPTLLYFQNGELVWRQSGVLSLKELLERT